MKSIAGEEVTFADGRNEKFDAILFGPGFELSLPFLSADIRKTLDLDVAHLENWPQLRSALLFGPLAPSSFRLEGPDALPDAASRFARDAAALGAITSNELTDRE